MYNFTDSYKVKYINKHYDIHNFFPNNKGSGNLKCPFHDDKHPSSKIYQNSFRCFRCGRFYYPINFIKKFNLDIDEIFYDLFSKYGKDSLEDENEKREYLQRENKDFITYTKEYFGIK